MGTPIESKQPQCMCCANQGGTDWYIVEDGTPIKWELLKLLQHYGEKTVQDGLLCNICRNKLSSISQMTQEFYNLYKENCVIQTKHRLIENSDEDIVISKNGPIVKSALLDTYLTGRPTVLTDGIQLILDYNCNLVHHHIDEFRLQGLFCDVNILADDGTRFKAHSSVLAASSDVLRQALYDKHFPVDIILPSVSPFSWNLLLQYMYTNRIIITSITRKKKFLQGLFNAATWLNIPKLIRLLKMYAPVFVRPDFVFTLPKGKKLLVNPCKRIDNSVQTEDFLFTEGDASHREDTNRTHDDKMSNTICPFCKSFNKTREQLQKHLLTCCRISDAINTSDKNDKTKITGSDMDEDNIQNIEKHVPKFIQESQNRKLKTVYKAISVGKVRGKIFRKACDVKRDKRKSLGRVESPEKKPKKENQYKCINEDCETVFFKQNEFIIHLKRCLTDNQYSDPMKLIQQEGNKYKLVDDASPVPDTQKAKFVQYPCFEIINKAFKRGSKEYKYYYGCLHCGQKEGGYRRIVDHVANVHRKTKAYMCGKCSKRFCGLPELKDHFLRYHCASSFIKCNECEEVFKCKDTLRVHKKNEHKNVDEQGIPLRRHKCDWCQKSFKLLHHKKTHEKFHLKNDEKPFKCGHCVKRFVSKSAMLEHSRMHTGEKPYKCKHCSFSTGRSTNLRFHERTHGYVNAKYKCVTCFKLFSRKENFHLHLLKKDHKGKQINSMNSWHRNITNTKNEQSKSVDKVSTSQSGMMTDLVSQISRKAKVGPVTCQYMNTPVSNDSTLVEEINIETTRNITESVWRKDGKVVYSGVFQNCDMGKADRGISVHESNVYKQSTCEVSCTSMPSESMSFLQQLESEETPQIHMPSTVDLIQPEIIPKVVLQYHCQESTQDQQHNSSPTCVEEVRKQMPVTLLNYAKSEMNMQCHPNEMTSSSHVQNIRKINLLPQVMTGQSLLGSNWVENHGSNLVNIQQDISPVCSERRLQRNLREDKQSRTAHNERNHKFYNVNNPSRLIGANNEIMQNNTAITSVAPSFSVKKLQKPMYKNSHHKMEEINCEVKLGKKKKGFKLDKQMEQLLHDSMSLENLAQSFHIKNSLPKNESAKELLVSNENKHGNIKCILDGNNIIQKKSEAEIKSGTNVIQDFGGIGGHAYGTCMPKSKISSVNNRSVVVNSVPIDQTVVSAKTMPTMYVSSPSFVLPTLSSVQSTLITSHQCSISKTPLTSSFSQTSTSVSSTPNAEPMVSQCATLYYSPL